MSTRIPVRTTLLILLLLFFTNSYAWWNDGWSFRKQIRIDVPADTAGLSGSVPILVRLSIGNFAFFGDVGIDGNDIRFVSSDDVTPLPFYIEKFDAVNQQALIWVQAPLTSTASATNFVYMYYGNPEAAAAGDASGVHGAETVLVYDFASPDGQVIDATAYGNNPETVSSNRTDSALIGNGAEFAPTSVIEIPAAPNLGVSSDTGFTASVWVRPGQIPAGDVDILASSSDVGSLALGFRGSLPRVTMTDGSATAELVAAGVDATADEWLHLAARLDGPDLTLYVNGKTAANGEAPLVDFQGNWTVGDPVNGFVGQVDQVQVSREARNAAAIRLAALAEAPFSSVLLYGDDAQREEDGGVSYVAITLRNVTNDGWFVMGLCAIMAVVSWVVMWMKSTLLTRIERQNSHFMREYSKLVGDPLALDQETDECETLGEESLLSMALEDESSYHPSTLFPLYHIGAAEVKKRMELAAASAVGADATRILKTQAIEAIRSSIDGGLVRQRQKMNRLMVLLTIAISGGPFLGLLGTVVGVMITFAAIAASGDVNVNAIAPGVAAALASTVAGLIVAIPALFGYNWLGSRIKNIDANTQVFADEYINRIAEYYG